MNKSKENSPKKMIKSGLAFFILIFLLFIVYSSFLVAFFLGIIVFMYGLPL